MPGTVTQISPSQVAALVEAGAAFVDVREHQETAAGKAPGVQCLPMQEITLEALPVDGPIVLICRSGSRSNAVAEALARAGFTAYNVSGGMQSWALAGLPVVTEDGRPGMVL